MRVPLRPFVLLLFMLLGACGVESAPVATIAPSATPTLRPLTAVPTFTATPTQAAEPTSGSVNPSPTLTAAASEAPTPVAAATVIRPVPSQPSLPARFAYFGRLGAGPGEIVSPTGIAVTADGVFISEKLPNRLERFNLQGGLVWKVEAPGSGNGQLSSPSGVALFNNQIYVADTNNRRVSVFNASNGTFIRTIGEGGTDVNQLSAPVAVAHDAIGKLFVADSANRRVQVYERDDSPLRMVGSGGGFNDQFGVLGPGGVVVAPNDSVYATDTSNDRIMGFDFRGKFFTAFGGSGTGNGQLKTPLGIALDRNGRLVVADAGNRRVAIFTQDGKFVENRSAGDFLLEPAYVSVDANGAIYVTDTTTLRVAVLR